MKSKKVKVASLKSIDRNCRRHTPAQIRELERSLKEFGQTRPFVIDEAGTVLVGNGMLAAMKSLGMEDAEAYVVSGWSESQKRKLMLADNKCYELGGTDIDVIFEDLKAFGSAGDFSVPGFDEDAIKSLCDSISNDALRATTSCGYDVSQASANKKYEAQTGRSVPSSGVPAIPEDEPIAEEVAAAPVIVRPVDGGPYIVCPHCGRSIPRN